MALDAHIYDFIIVGAGIAGASVAYRLAQQHSVLVLEREDQPGYHSTGRSAAMFQEAYGTPQIRALTRASRSFYEHPPEGFCESPIMTPRGCFYVAKPDQLERLEQSRSIEGLAPIDLDTVFARVPCLNKNLVAGALFEEDAQDLDVHVLHQGYLKGMRKQGGELKCNAEVVSAAWQGAMWQVTLADGAVLQAKVLVNAAGAWADVMAHKAGVKAVGLQPKRRTAFTFSPKPEYDFSQWPSVCGITDDFYFKPDAGQLLGCPCNVDPVEPQDVQPEELDIALGVHHIEEMTDMRIGRPNHVWAGLRSFVADGDLVVGFDDAKPAFFWLAAQGGYGIQSSAGVSLLAYTLLTKQALPESLTKQGVQPELLGPARLR